MERTAAVTGASGFVGSAIVRELLARGWRVQGLVRQQERGAAVLGRHEGLRLVEGDVLEPRTLRELTLGAGACVNAIGILRERAGQTFRKAHVQAVSALVEAGRDAGVERFVHISALGVSDEGTTAYQRSKAEGERLVRTGGLPWTILRPSLIHGPRSEFMRLAKGWVKGEKQPWFFLPYFTRGVPIGDVPFPPIRREAASVAPVAVEDVAWAAAESLEREDAIGEVFNLCGPETLTWPDLLRAIRDAVPGANETLEPLGIPAETAAKHARIAKRLGLGGLLPFDEGMPIMGATDSVAEPAKARAMLGFQPRPFRATLRRYAASIA